MSWKTRNRKSSVPSHPQTNVPTMTTSADVKGPYWVNNLQAQRMLNVYHFITDQYGWRFRPNKEDLNFFEWLGSTNRLPAYLKWKTANILARAVGSPDLVPCPIEVAKIPKLYDYYFRPELLGLLRTDNGFHRMKLAKKSKTKYAAYAFSMYQAKSGSLPGEEWEKEKGIRDTVQRLVCPKFISESLMTPSGLLTSEDVEDEVIRTVDEIFLPRSESQPSYRLPSKGSCVGCNRMDGGMMGSMVRDVLGYDALWYEHFQGFYETPNGVLPYYARLHPDDIEWFYLQCRQEIISCPKKNPCQPVALLEPFKVRVITKGYAPAYAIGRLFQPRIWGRLKDYPTFRLIGEPLTHRVMVQYASDLSPDDELWHISGDYKEATDHIPSFLGELALERVCSRVGVPTEYVPSLIAGLTQHRFIRQESDKTVILGDQASGQLMGSPLSFPILCILNAALSRLAYETAGPKRLRMCLSDIPMLVNGDDLLIGGALNHFLNWKRVVGWAGLIPSVGKTLVSQRFATINSRLFRIDPKLGVSGTRYFNPVQVPHVQLSLALGNMKSGKVDLSGNVRDGLDCRAQERTWSEFMDSCPRKGKAWKFLFKANMARLMGLASFFPCASFCLPIRAGGLGFPVAPDDLGDFQLRRSPRRKSLILARLLLEETGHRAFARLQSAWVNSLNLRDDLPAEHLLFEMLSAQRKAVGLMPVARKRESNLEVRTVIPPSVLNYNVATGNTYESNITAAHVRRVVLRKVDGAIKNYVKSGRGPWTLAEVFSFLKSTDWVHYERYDQSYDLCPFLDT